jgi:DNA repair protein RadC
MRTMPKSNTPKAMTESIKKPSRTQRSTSKNQQAFEDTFIRETRVSYVHSKQALFKIRSASDVATFVRSVLTDNSREHFVAMFLDAMHQVTAYSIVSIGTANYAVVTPREVYQRAIVAGAIAIAVAHNHPSGSPLPSDEDHKVTKRLFESGVLLGIKLLDHVVVTDNEHYSFSENGVL